MHNADFEEAMAKEDEPGQLKPHPLFEHCQELNLRVNEAIEANGWLPDDAQEEHPLNALQHGISLASVKLAGALNGRGYGWPPEALFAGDCLVRLKKARTYLKDALAGLEAVEGEQLADPAWMPPIRQEIQALLSEVNQLIDEVRAVLEADNGLSF